MSIKKTVLRKKIEGVIYEYYLKTSADLIEYDSISSVADKISDILYMMDEYTNTNIDDKICKVMNYLYNKIMGIVDDKTTIIETFDTLKEVSDYLINHKDIVDKYSNDINNLKFILFDKNNGLIKKINDLDGIVKVSKSKVNGNIKINDKETKIYDDSSIDASKIVEDELHLFSTDKQKNKWHSDLNIILSSAYNENDLTDSQLLMQDVTEYNKKSGLYKNDEYTDWNTLIKNGMITVDGNKLIRVSENISGDLVVDKRITDIADNVCHSCINLTSIVLPNGITKITDYSFNSCIDLKKIIMPKSVRYIGIYAFCCCTSLESIEIPYGVNTIEIAAFAACSSLKSIILPESVTKIADVAFCSCEALEYIEIPDSVTYIGYSIFSSCSSLKCIKYKGKEYKSETEFEKRKK